MCVDCWKKREVVADLDAADPTLEVHHETLRYVRAEGLWPVDNRPDGPVSVASDRAADSGAVGSGASPLPMAITGSGMVDWARFWVEIGGLAATLVLGFVMFWAVSGVLLADDKEDERDSHEVL